MSTGNYPKVRLISMTFAEAVTSSGISFRKRSPLIRFFGPDTLIAATGESSERIGAATQQSPSSRSSSSKAYP